MHEDYEKLFTHLPIISPHQNSVDRVLERIKYIEERRKQYRFFSGLILFIASLVALPYAVEYLRLEMTQSGFAQYLSLLFSDGGSITIYWKSFSLSLIESLPILSMTVFFAMFGVALFSLRQMILNAKTFPYFKLR